MPIIWEPQPSEVYLSWIDAITEEASDKLNDWEAGFINDIEGQLRLRGTLSERQASILERIYAEKTS